MAASYIKPIAIPPGIVGRVDQGVDICAPASTPIHAIGAGKMINIIPNWYAGQPYGWFSLNSGGYWYAAEQVSFSKHPGDSVSAGEVIGQVAPVGTCMEFGWAVANGETLARATTGYVEGQATAAGTSFMNQVIKGGGGPPPGATGPSSGISRPNSSSGTPSDPGCVTVPAMIAMAYLLRKI